MTGSSHLISPLSCLAFALSIQFGLQVPLVSALVLTLALAIHEGGHVAGLRALRMPVGPPIFIPFVGAFVRLPRDTLRPADASMVALLGPLAGSVAAAAALLAFEFTHTPWLIQFSQISAFLSALNLVPCLPLDGGRIVATTWRWLHVVGLLSLVAFAVAMQSWVNLGIAVACALLGGLLRDPAVDCSLGPITGRRPRLETLAAYLAVAGLTVLVYLLAVSAATDW